MREEILIPGLRDRGFEHLVGVGSAIETYRAVLARDFSMFVLDIGLPDEDGFAVARHLRANSDAGIVMLTGRVGNAEQVHGLETGADAYLAKPVDLDILAATLRSVMRRLEPRPAAGTAATDRSGWRVDETWSLVGPHGGIVRLTHLEYLLASLLFARAGQTVTRETIIACLSRDIHAFDPHRLEMLVHRLRRKVLKAFGHELPLSSVRGVGYVLTLR